MQLRERLYFIVVSLITTLPLNCLAFQLCFTCLLFKPRVCFFLCGEFVITLNESLFYLKVL